VHNGFVKNKKKLNKKQSEAYCGCQYCYYWVHNGFVNIDNEKMSKSLGNFRTLREACKDALDVRAFRLNKKVKNDMIMMNKRLGNFRTLP